MRLDSVARLRMLATMDLGEILPRLTVYFMFHSQLLQEVWPCVIDQWPYVERHTHITALVSSCVRLVFPLAERNLSIAEVTNGAGPYE